MDSETFCREFLPARDRMFRLALSMLGDGAEAEDAVQDVLERLWSRRGDLGRYGNLEAMAVITVRNFCLDRLRAKGSRLKREEKVRAKAESESDIHTPVEMRDMGRIAGELISALPEKQRLVMHLRDVEGYEMEEIAVITDMDAAAVRVTLSRARKTIREKLQKIIDYGNE